MSSSDTIEILDARILEVKQERKACKTNTMLSINKLHELLRNNVENSEEKAEAVAEPLA